MMFPKIFGIEIRGCLLNRTSKCSGNNDETLKNPSLRTVSGAIHCPNFRGHLVSQKNLGKFNVEYAKYVVYHTI